MISSQQQPTKEMEDASTLLAGHSLQLRMPWEPSILSLFKPSTLPVDRTQ
jgi:hypothetical protein